MFPLFFYLHKQSTYLQHPLYLDYLVSTFQIMVAPHSCKNNERSLHKHKKFHYNRFH